MKDIGLIKKQLSEWKQIEMTAFWQNFMKRIEKKREGIWEMMGVHLQTYDDYLILFGRSRALDEIRQLPKRMIEELEKAKSG